VRRAVKKILKKAKAKKDTESVRDVRAEGGRAGHALGHTAGRLTKTLERVGGGPEGKPHSTKKGRIAAGVRRIKRGAKSWNKKLNKMAKDAHLGRPFMKLEKPKKKKDYVIDPDETFGGRRKEKRRSVRPEPLDKLKRLPLTVREKTDPRRIKKLKRKKYDLKYSPGPGKATLEKRYQEPLDKRFSREQGPGAPPIPSPQDPKHFKEMPPRFAGGGKALRGLGRAFVKKGGKV
jgi:hypothetical protein